MFETINTFPAYFQVSIIAFVTSGTLWFLCALWTFLLIPSISYVYDKKLDYYSKFLPLMKLKLPPFGDDGEYDTEVLNMFIAAAAIYIGAFVWPLIIIGGSFYGILFTLRFINRTIRRVDHLGSDYE